MKKREKLKQTINLSPNNRKQNGPINLGAVTNYIRRQVSGSTSPINPPGGLDYCYCFNHYYDSWSGCHGWTCDYNGTNYAVFLCGKEFSYYEL